MPLCILIQTYAYQFRVDTGTRWPYAIDMFLRNSIVSGIHKYRKEYVENELLPDIYCSKNDGTHLPLVIRVDNTDRVYLYCLSCDFEKQAGLVTLDQLMRLMKWRDLNPSLPFLDTEIKV